MSGGSAEEDHGVDLGGRGGDGREPHGEGEHREALHGLLAPQGRVHLHPAEVLVQVADALQLK